MARSTPSRPSRRAVLRAGGALVVSFSLAARAWAQEAPAAAPPAPPPAPPPPPRPGSLRNTPMLDAWIRIDQSGTVTVFTGKCELGQGIKTALMQVAAEQLGVPVDAIAMITSDTARTPAEGYTAGSQ